MMMMMIMMMMINVWDDHAQACHKFESDSVWASSGSIRSNVGERAIVSAN